ncbi:DUF4355 domain-containing protein [Latilactobacillus curvatus]|uniref:capsid assembly scaffolding protein Gp46 family protein n=1 Tax=Latilactobacillus curvatus TaxID=28038 RepID=UPI002030C0CA|nr:DUF4355 domain-containing protein [Latilactobacillus curvatus]MCM0724316.1 DUF4355 domain-containing protein [Latilactobacillus curvatus]
MENEEQIESTAADKTEQVGDETTNPEGQENQLDADKTVAKLQKRIGKEQAEKQGFKAQLDDALKQIEDLKSGKSVKELSDEEKAKKAEDDKVKRIKELEDKLARTESIKQTDAVFKEAGLNVGDDVLEMVVSSDDDKTFANAKALIEFANSIESQTRQGFLKGRTPKETGSPVKKMTREQIMAIPDDFKRKQAIADNFELFN